MIKNNEVTEKINSSVIARPRSGRSNLKKWDCFVASLLAMTKDGLFQRSNNKGLTLLEIIIVAFLFSIISAAIFSVLATGRNSLSAGESQIGVQQACRNGLDSMIKELRQSSVSTIQGVPSDGVNYNSITFQIPAVIGASGITWSSSIQYSLGGLNDTQLLRTQSGSQKVLANNISALSFNRSALNPNVVNVSITAQKNTFPGFTARQTTITLTSQVTLRN